MAEELITVSRKDFDYVRKWHKREMDETDDPIIREHHRKALVNIQQKYKPKEE